MRDGEVEFVFTPNEGIMKAKAKGNGPQARLDRALRMSALTVAVNTQRNDETFESMLRRASDMAAFLRDGSVPAPAKGPVMALVDKAAKAN